MSTNFRTWLESPTVGDNVLSNADFDSDTQRQNGFVAGNVIRSKMMNTILRQNSLIAVALMEQFCPSSTVDLVSSLANVKSALAAGVASKSALDSLGTTVSGHTTDIGDLQTAVNGITGESGSLATLQGEIDAAENEISGLDGRMDTAETNISNLRTDVDALSGGADQSISSLTTRITQIENGTTTVGNASDAVNVTTKIGGKNITAIFETDGTTVKSATYAATAGSVNSTTNLAGGATGQIPYQSGVGATAFLTAGTNGQILSNVNGLPSWLNPAVLTVGNASTANSATTASSALTATLATYLAGGSAGSIPYQTASNTTAMLAKGTQGYVLCQGADAPEWVDPSTIIGGGGGTSTLADNIKGGSAGKIPFQTAANSTSFTTAGTSGYLLQSRGSSASGPTWVNPANLSVSYANNAGNASTLNNKTLTMSIQSGVLYITYQ